jgi:hypothetical protein
VPPVITWLVFEIKSEALEASCDPLRLVDVFLKKLFCVNLPYSAKDVLKNYKVDVFLNSSSEISSP